MNGKRNRLNYAKVTQKERDAALRSLQNAVGAPEDKILTSAGKRNSRNFIYK